MTNRQLPHIQNLHAEVQCNCLGVGNSDVVVAVEGDDDVIVHGMDREKLVADAAVVG